MRKLIILHGLLTNAKNEFIKKYDLSNYVISEDTLRQMIASTNIELSGQLMVSHRDDKWLFEKTKEIIERRFMHGLFTVYNPTVLNQSELTQLKQLSDKYDYKIICVDFTNVSLEELLQKNKDNKVQPITDKALQKYYYKTKTLNFSSNISMIKPSDGEEIFEHIKDYSKWKAIHFIGDIHGCYDCLKEAISPIDKNELYVFCGDYLDRGIQNAETLKYLFELQDLPNTIFLVGNHEKHLRNWAYKENIFSQHFQNYTKKELESNGISLKRTKRFCELLQECFYGEYYGKRIFACHGGISNLVSRIDFIATEQLIGGVGKHRDSLDVEKNFFKNNPNIIMIHGHRNANHNNICPVQNCYNLENEVENGGTLRVLTITPTDIITKEVINTVFDNSIRNFTDTEIKYLKENSTNLVDEKTKRIMLRKYQDTEFKTISINNLKGNVKPQTTVYQTICGTLCYMSSHNKNLVYDAPEGFQEALENRYGKQTTFELNIYANQNNLTYVFLWNKNGNQIALIDILENIPELSKFYNEKTTEFLQKHKIVLKRKIETIRNNKNIKNILKRNEPNKTYIIENTDGTMTYVVPEPTI